MQAVEKLSGGATGDTPGVKVRENLRERLLKGRRAGDAGQRADDGGFGLPSAMVKAESVATHGGAAAAAPVVAHMGTAWCGIGETEVGPGQIDWGVGGGGGIDSRDTRVQRSYRNRSLRIDGRTAEVPNCRSGTLGDRSFEIS
jgi:hypothetical protein